MGTFTLSPDFVMPKDTDKDVEIPEHAIIFEYDPRATADDELINYIVQQSHKMKSLAAADLESYLVLGKQFLNIGKPFPIEGMGMLLKNQQGELEFTRGNAFHAKAEASPMMLREKAESEISFASEGKPNNSNKKGLLIALLVIGLGLTAVSVWYLLTQKSNNTGTVAAVTEDSLTPADTLKDTVAKVPPAPVVPDDGYTFKVVFLVTPDSSAAASRMNTLETRGHKVIMYKQDSVNYRLAEPFTLPLADTTRIKDSLNSYYYAGKAFIQIK
jgi:hypothetical protein